MSRNLPEVTGLAWGQRGRWSAPDQSTRELAAPRLGLSSGTRDSNGSCLTSHTQWHPDPETHAQEVDKATLRKGSPLGTSVRQHKTRDTGHGARDVCVTRSPSVNGGCARCCPLPSSLLLSQILTAEKRKNIDVDTRRGPGAGAPRGRGARPADGGTRGGGDGPA